MPVEVLSPECGPRGPFEPCTDGRDPGRSQLGDAAGRRTVSLVGIAQGFQPPLPYGRVMTSKRCPSGSSK
jgi:hypothetical protein